MANSLTGHTKGSNEGLFDGSHILSPSFTNLYELGTVSYTHLRAHET